MNSANLAVFVDSQLTGELVKTPDEFVFNYSSKEPVGGKLVLDFPVIKPDHSFHIGGDRWEQKSISQFFIVMSLKTKNEIT